MKNEIRQFLDEGRIKEAAAFIKEAIKNGANLEGLNVNLAHILLLAGEWEEITALLPKNTNFFHTSGWLNSLRCNRPISEDNKPIPWFTYPAIDFLDDIVQKNWLVFEWGSGNSTLWWASKVEKVIAIEDNQEWFMEVKNKLPQNSEIFNRTGSEYYDSILKYPDYSFDAIIIDGSYRTEAATKCTSKIKDQGIIIFDNSDAMEHELAQSFLKNQGFYRIDFWGLIPSYLYKNCTSIYFKDAAILKQKNIPTSHISSVGISCQQSIDRITGKSRLFEDDVKVCAVKNLKEWAKDNDFELINVILEGSYLPPKYAMESFFPLWKESIKTYFENMSTDYHVVHAKNVIINSFGWSSKEQPDAIDGQFDMFSPSYDMFVEDRFWLPYIAGKGMFRSLSPDCLKMVIDFTSSRIVKITGKCVFIGSRINFGHWMAEFLSKMAAFEKISGKTEYKLLFAALSKNQKAALSLLGIRPSQIIELEVLLGQSIRYHFEDLLFIPHVPLTVASNYLRNRFAEAVSRPDQGPERVYISRRMLFPRHRVANIDEVEEFFQKKGFLIISNLKDIPFKDQVSLLSNVKIMVVTAGADWGNLSMCNNRAAIIVLVSEKWGSKQELEFSKHIAIPYFVTTNLPVIPVLGKPVNSEETVVDELATFDLIDLDQSIKMAMELRKKICEGKIKSIKVIYNSSDSANNTLSIQDRPAGVTLVEKPGLNGNSSPLLKNPAVRTLAFFLSQREAYRPIMFSTNEVFCSPDCESTKSNGTVKTIQTHGGIYDIKQVVDQLPSSQKPELIVVKTDATGRNFPINLQQYHCPKLLILGDSHHLKMPIQTLLVYAAQEKFDYIISDHDRHHLHYFKEAGFDNVFWIPCYNVYPHEQPLFSDKLYDVSFVGQVGRWHPYRKTVLQFLQANDVPVQIMQAPHEKAAEIYAKSLINLNISLNGDFNLRVFEVLSSGGFLLTDRLSRESGLEMIFKDGEHLVCYDSPQDLLEKIHYYLNHPSEAKAIAHKGYEEYKRHHTPETKTNELMDFILKGQLNPLYEIQKDSRSIYLRSKSKEDIFQRISTYEYFQDVHLKNHEPAALFFPSVDPRLLCDVSDLPRLRLYIKGIETDIPDTSLQLFNDTNIADRIHALSLEDLKKIQGAWDIIVLTASDLVDQNLEDFLISLNFKLLVVSDSLSSIDEDSRVKLMEYFSANGLEKIHENPDVFFWKDKSLWGEYLFSKGFTADAVKNFERALADNPANENALNNLGVISYQLNRYEAAEKFMVKAVSLNRRNINSLNNLVQLYMTMERFEDAAGLLLEITGMNPEQPEPWYLLGLCQERLNQLDSAFDAFKKAEKFDGSAYPMPEGLHVQLEKSLFAKNNSQSRIPPPKILVINNLYPPQEMGGYGRLLFDFTNILRKRGHSIYVLTSDSPYLGNTDGDKPDVHRSLVLFGGWEGGVCKTMENKDDIIRIVRKNIAGLEQLLKEFRPDACLLGNIDFLSRNIMNPMLDKKIPIIHHMGNQQPGYAVSETPKNRLYHLAAASNWLKNEIQKQGYPLKDISVVFPGALVEEFRMRIPPALDKLRIVYASIVLPYKGPHILINALKKLHDSGIDFSCSIAGTSTDKSFVDSLKSFVAGNGMEDRIRFLGFLPREELKNLFARHNVLVFPSLFQEPFGISQVEAMAAGLTVVTSGTGGAKEIVEHGVSGIIFKTEDDASLAEELIQLAKYPLKCQQIALAGQRRATEKFDIERSVDSLESCFARLLQTKGIR